MKAKKTVYLPPYAAFAVERLADLQGCSQSEVLRRMVFAFEIDHAEYLDSAGAGLREWRSRCVGLDE